MKDNKESIKLVVFPKDPNPYQDLLYSSLDRRLQITYLTPAVGNTISLFTVIPSTMFRLIGLRLSGNRLIHIHWVYPFYVSKRVPLNKQLTYLYISLFLGLLSVLRYKVIWTVHNVVPQQPVSSNDQKLMQKLANIAAVKIVHSGAVLSQMQALDISTQHSKVIPIGSYQGIYSDNISSKDARKKLGITQNEFVVLFFGTISRYKGVEDLIAAFPALGLPNARLLIVGRCMDKSLLRSLQQSTRHPKIDLYEGFVPDDKVATYFKASDIVCLPFRNITTSSSILLALAFAKPVIAPRLGTLNDLPSSVGYFYKVDEPNALVANLKLAANNADDLASIGSNGKAYSDTLTWDKIAAQTEKIYANLVNL